METIFFITTTIVLLLLYIKELLLKKRNKKSYNDLSIEYEKVLRQNIEENTENIKRIESDIDFINKIKSNESINEELIKLYENRVKITEELIEAHKERYKIMEEALETKEELVKTLTIFISNSEEKVNLINERLSLLSKENFKVIEQNELMRERLRNLGITDFDVI